MLTKHMTPKLPEGEPDPSTPTNRLELARRLLIRSIGRYENALAFVAESLASNPRLPRPLRPADMGEAEVAERRAWKWLIDEANDDFDAAEAALASRLMNLWRFLAPEGMRHPDAPGELFVPRAVRHAGSVYVLNYDAGEYEKETNIISVFREGFVLDLGGGAAGDVA
jgi:hypothetical protein